MERNETASATQQEEPETAPTYVVSAEQEAALARARFASSVTKASRSGRVVVKRAVEEARPFLMGAVAVATLGAALLIRALARPARRALRRRSNPWVVKRPSFGQRMAQALVSAIASAALRRLAGYVAARMDESPQLTSGDPRVARQATRDS